MRIIFVFLSFICSATLSAQTTLTADAIVQKAIDNKSQNDPREALESFSLHAYEKTIITDSLNGSSHNFFSEKASLVQYDRESDFTEEIMGYQLAGFKNPRYEVFAVNIQSRSFYDSDFVIFNNRYAGILSKRGVRNYNYTLQETAPEEDYIISFTPKAPKRIPGLTGTMVLDRETLAIKDVKVRINDKLNIVLNQEYTYLEDNEIYLPVRRELFLDKGEEDRKLSFFKGRISIGTIENEVVENIVSRKFLVSTTTMSDFKINEGIDKELSKYAITFDKEANNRPEDFWKKYRSENLTTKDKRSFSEIEKIVNAENIERRLGTTNNFSIGYFSFKAFDFDLTYPVKFNNYEGLRLGIGGVTNESFSKRFRLEGYTAYGFKDKDLKYGIGGGYLLNPDKGAWISATYNSDLEEVGNYAYLTDRRVYSLFEPRLVNITQFYKHRTTRINLEYRLTPQILSEFQIAHRRLDQTTPYRYNKDGEIIRDYDVTEATASFRWSPSNKYLKTDSDVLPVYEGHPIISGQISQAVDGLGGDLAFTKLAAKMFYRVDRLNKTATEVLLEGNIAFGDLPITHLFHAFPNAPTKETILQRFSVAGVNSFETMYFGEFFSDRLFTAQIKHRLAPFNISKRFKPEMVFISRFALGDIRNPEDHLDIDAFGSLSKGYTETGFELNKLLFGFGTSLTYRYGAYHLPNWEDNIAFKFTFNLKL
ncbi:DUF5686 family protein [Dokdonia genika]|uniref:DUF5686 family protein n=1 Tax=Dokdonia genika TaxID=308113 RepID=A0ABV9LAN8_9FLAO